MAMGQTYEFASGAALYYTKSYIEECSAYDESYLLWEDGPFLARATRNGVQVEMAYDIISILYRDGGISDFFLKKNYFCENLKYIRIIVGLTLKNFWHIRHDLLNMN